MTEQQKANLLARLEKERPLKGVELFYNNGLLTLASYFRMPTGEYEIIYETT